MSISSRYNLASEPRANNITLFNRVAHDSTGGVNAVLGAQPNNVVPAPAENFTIGQGMP